MQLLKRLTLSTNTRWNKDMVRYSMQMSIKKYELVTLVSGKNDFNSNIAKQRKKVNKLWWEIQVKQIIEQLQKYTLDKENVIYIYSMEERGRDLSVDSPKFVKTDTGRGQTKSWESNPSLPCRWLLIFFYKVGSFHYQPTINIFLDTFLLMTLLRAG